LCAATKALKQRLEEIENHLRGHAEDIQGIFRAIRQLMTPPEKPRKRIGLEVSEPKGRYGKRTMKAGGEGRTVEQDSGPLSVQRLSLCLDGIERILRVFLGQNHTDAAI